MRLTSKQNAVFNPEGVEGCVHHLTLCPTAGTGETLQKTNSSGGEALYFQEEC